MKRAWIPAAVVIAVVGLIALGYLLTRGGPHPEDERRLEAVRQDRLVDFVPIGALVTEREDSVGERWKDLHGNVTESGSNIRLELEGVDWGTAPREYVDALEANGYDIVYATCNEMTITLQGARRDDGFDIVAHVGIKDDGGASLSLNAPYHDHDDSEIILPPDVSPECAATLGLEPGAPPGCERWCPDD